MLTGFEDVNLTPSSTPGPAGLPSPPFVQQKLLLSRGNRPQSVGAAVLLDDHNPGVLVVCAPVAVCVTLSSVSANTLSVTTTCRTRTSVPSPARGPRRTNADPRRLPQRAAGCGRSVTPRVV